MHVASRRIQVAASLAIVAMFGGVSLSLGSRVAAPSVPERVSDEAFWRMVTEFSEPGGFFRSDNFVSNEITFQWVLPEIAKTTKTGGVYMGVGPDQNFTYIVAMQPRIAFIVDIRRQNMLHHLLYKSLIEMSGDRAEFLSRLFSRPRPAGIDADAGQAGCLPLREPPGHVSGGLASRHPLPRCRQRASARGTVEHQAARFIRRQQRCIEGRQRIQQGAGDALRVILDGLAHVHQKDLAGIEQLFDFLRVQLGDLVGRRVTHRTALILKRYRYGARYCGMQLPGVQITLQW